MEEQYREESVKRYGVQSTNTMPNVALVLGIVGICTACIPVVNFASLVLGVLAAIFGVIGLCKKLEFGKSVAALVLGIFSVILMIMMYASVFFFVNWVITEGQSTEESAPLDEPGDATEDQTAEILADMLDVRFGTFNVEEGIANELETSLIVTVTNKSGGVQSFDITVDAYDLHGRVIATETFYADELEPWQGQRFAIFDSVDEEDIPGLQAATFRVAKVSLWEN